MISKDIIIKLLDKTISPEELSQLQAWRDSSDDNAQAFAKLMAETMNERMVHDEHPYDVDAAFERFNASRRPKLFTRWLQVAAVAVILIVGVTAWFMHSADNEQPVYYTFTTLQGETKTVTMSDGTIIKLCAASTLRYDDSYGKDARRVELTGEAIFNVQHDDNNPFSVVTPSITVTDLGTVFRLADYQEDATASVKLAEGLIASSFNGDAQTVTLHPGEVLLFDKKSHRQTKRSLNTPVDDVCNQSQLVFEGETLASIAHTISRVYGVKVEVSEQVAQQQFFGVFNTCEDSVQTVLNALANVSQTTLQKTGHTYLLH